jgi:DNA polymerase III delta subunit
MLHLYYGSDTNKIREKAIGDAREHSIRIERIDSDTFSLNCIEDAVQTISLFGDNPTYVVDTPTANPELWESLLNNIESIKFSDKLFVVIEGDISVATLKKIQPFANKTEVFKKNKPIPFNIFSLADALLHKDKKNLWLLYCESLQFGHTPEEIIGTLWWQLKILRIAIMTNSFEEAGIKEYPYNKAKRVIRNFKVEEIDSLMTNLVLVYHQGHSGEKDIAIGLEEWVLSV